MKGRTVLITGATGILGSWVLGEALRRGYKPVALMRDATESRAKARLEAVLHLQGLDDRLDEVEIAYGDTRLPDLGLEAKDVARLRSTLGGMIHCAASTSFNPRCDAELWATNVGGVANVLHFLAGSGIPLYHISTAFVAGKRKGLVHENELNMNQGFNNTYERSKCESECLVQEAMAKGSVKSAIFRPAIIIGSSEGGRISQFLNFYSFLRFMDIASSGRLGNHGRLRVKANPDATKNLIPVDWTSEALWTIIEKDGPSGETYHLTNPNPVSLASLNDWASEYLGSDKIHIDFTNRLEGTLNPLERAANASFRLYGAYLQDEPLFDRANTDRALDGKLPFPQIGPKQYLEMLDYARERNWEGVFGCQSKIAKVKDNDEQGAEAPSEVDSDSHCKV